jgi:hypothetical protein
MSKMRFTFNQYQEKEPTPDILQNLNSKKDDDYDDDDEDSFDLNKWRFGDTQQIADELTRYLAAPVLTLDSAAANDAFNALE